MRKYYGSVKLNAFAGLWEMLSLLLCLAVFSCSVVAQQIELDESCVINILNRTVQVQSDGMWALSNVPSNMGQVRDRATCVVDGITYSGQSEYFSVATNAPVNVPLIYFDLPKTGPVRIEYSPNLADSITGVGESIKMIVFGHYKNGQDTNVRLISSGINYVKVA